MFEAKLTIEAPGLTTAINRLADAIAYSRAPATAPSTNSANPTPGAVNMGAPTPAQPTGTPVPAAPMTGPTAAPAQATGVPLAPAPQYTVDQIMQAGATLMDAGKVNELMNLLHSFGVQAVMDLKPEQLGAFATAMRELGAKI